jgi:hypothetical protein
LRTLAVGIKEPARERKEAAAQSYYGSDGWMA